MCCLLHGIRQHAFLLSGPEQVDINIHPRKEEVQFLHPRMIEQLIQNG